MRALPYEYLTDPGDVRAALAAFANQPVIGLDTETFMVFSQQQMARQNRLSLLQLASPTGEVIVVDALAAGLEEARGLIEDPSAMMAAHSARFDDGVLRQAGFAVSGLVDTLKLARRTFRLKSFSLSSVSDHLFGLRLDKSYQQSDWRKRPLSREQLDYAALDAQIALQVFQELSERLESTGRLEQELHRARIFPADVASERRRGIQPVRKKIPSVELRPLTAEERRIVEKLRDWRRRMASSENVPTYMICQDKTLEHLAIARPRQIEALSGIYGLGESKITRYGDQILSQLNSI